VDFGLKLDDKALLSVLLDDWTTLERILKEKPETVTSKYSLRCAYTQMVEVRYYTSVQNLITLTVQKF
jgi:hypothetical protein